MSDGTDRQAELDRMAAGFRPELHRYAARLVGSSFEGEDIVQDALTRAFANVSDLPSSVPLKAWLIRITHNVAVDLLRARAIRRHESIDFAADLCDPDDNPEEQVANRLGAALALRQFLELSVQQRSALILKDVLGHSLDEIADLLGISLGATKAVLHRARARAAALSAAPVPTPQSPPSARLQHYVGLFNARDWEGLTALLAQDVRLDQAGRAGAEGRSAVASTFFAGYAATIDWCMAPAWMEGREVVAIFEPRHSDRPAYVMALEWSGDRISRLRDFRYAQYVMEGAGLVVTSDED